MKIIAYVDIGPWMTQDEVTLINRRNVMAGWARIEGGKRYCLTFEVPDPIEVDGEVQASVEQVKI